LFGPPCSSCRSRAARKIGTKTYVRPCPGPGARPLTEHAGRVPLR
jgi:hypothetical protein